jgi:hydrogenase maturation protease
MAAHDGRTIVIGIGNPDRGDDAAGRLAARRLAAVLPPAIEVSEHHGEVASLLAAIESAAAVYLIDACASGAKPGTVRRFDATSAPLPHETFGLSSHGLGLAEAIELARALGQLPPLCIVYAIEAGSVEPGGAVSPAVSAAIEETCERLRRELLAATSEEGQSDA